jgi:endonuclease YncB( thermonuclease family)
LTPALLLCLVIGIPDGDSLTARCEIPSGHENVKVRLAEIDAPQRGQPFGTKSRQALAALCFNEWAVVAPLNRDRCGRTVALVECRGKDAGTAQVEAGLAWAFARYKPSPEIKELQDKAKAARRGLWADEQPVPPWEWRRAKSP